MTKKKNPNKKEKTKKSVLGKVSRKSMGKGLSSLFTPSDVGDLIEPTKPASKDAANNSPNNSSPNTLSATELDINKIIANPNQPRNYFDPTTLAELTTSIKEVGIIEPLIVRKSKDDEEKYELIAGERRWRAAKKASLKTVPVVIKNIVSDDLLEIMLIENIQREDLSPIEEAESYQLLLNQKNLTHEQLSQKIGKSRGHITNLLRILNLPLSAKILLSEGKLTFSQAKVILTYIKELNPTTLDEVIQNTTDMTVRDLEAHLKKISSPLTKTKKKINDTTDPNLSAIENELRDKLKTKIKISPLKKGVGKIEIDYYDYEQLNDLIEPLK